MSRRLKIYCVGHTLPVFAPPVPYDMLCPASLGIPNELVIEDNRFGSSIDGSSLAEYSQLFGLHDKLLNGDIVADDLFLFQYRKFISPTFGGAESVSPWIRMLTPELAPSVFPSTEQMQTHTARLAVGSLFALGESISANYARVHVIEDLVMFAAACAESGALSQADIKMFATQAGIIPSPALCYIHADLFVKIIDILKKVWDHYYPHYQLVRTGDQRRVAGHLLERLHGVLLCKWLMDNSEPDIQVWQRYMISDPEQSATANGATKVSLRNSAHTRNAEMKILIDAVFFQYNRSGIARVWRSLLKEWVRDGFIERILVLDRENTAPRIPGVVYRVIPAHSYAAPDQDKAMLQKVCDEEDAGLFVSSYYTTPIATPSVFMAYDMIPEVLNWDIAGNAGWREKHAGILHASAYIAISQNTANDLQRFFPAIVPEQVSIAHCGVDFKSPGDARIDAFKAHHKIERPYFLLVGSRAAYKNGDLFFRAFASLEDKRADYSIVCTGPWSRLEPEFAVHVGDGCVHMLELDDEELQCAYAGAIALVYPSLYEGFGMPIVEAMACACPVITCAVASIPEVAGEAVLYVDPSDAANMTNALSRVQEPTIRAVLIEKGLQQAAQFSWGVMAAEVKDALLRATRSREGFVSAGSESRITHKPPKEIMSQVNLYHIAYSPKTLREVASGYKILNNVNNERNDWREYWPIRRFLLDETLDDQQFYGFFSPRFQEKTGLTHAQVTAFIQAAGPDTDVASFSPQPDMSAFFLNVFEQGELFDPGLTAACEAFLATAGMPLQLTALVMDSRQIIFSNYFVARAAFWRAWLALNEKLFAICEGQDSALKQLLVRETSYPGAVQRKVFVMERVASLLLTVQPEWRVCAYNTFDCAWSASRLSQFKLEAVLSDALKIAIREQGFHDYHDAYAKVRDQLR